MSRLTTLRRNERGAAAIEFAIAVPILILMIYGIFRLGLLFQANAGMQHALGEGARYATIYPTPTNTQIQTKMNARSAEAREVGLSLFEKSSDRFLHFGRFEPFAEMRVLEFEALEHFLGAAVANQLLGQAQRLGGLGQQSGDGSGQCFVELALANDVAD
ncbi:MAG: pilus assembly protein, partial [Sphingomonas sp.]|nr:pilus assembly protein [Sphingomonas sp.]